MQKEAPRRADQLGQELVAAPRTCVYVCMCVCMNYVYMYVCLYVCMYVCKPRQRTQQLGHKEVKATATTTTTAASTTTTTTNTTAAAAAFVAFARQGAQAWMVGQVGRRVPRHTHTHTHTHHKYIHT